MTFPYRFPPLEGTTFPERVYRGYLVLPSFAIDVDGKTILEGITGTDVEVPFAVTIAEEENICWGDVDEMTRDARLEDWVDI